MKILFGPDYRKTNSYQTNLERALAATVGGVDYGRHHQGVFPLWRNMRGGAVDLFHLHWPEAYWMDFEKRIKRRLPRFPFAPLLYLIDLKLALAFRKTRLVVTAHNIWPHAGGDDYWVRKAFKVTAKKAAVIIAHSERAAEEVADAWQVNPAKIVVIPHGDLSEVFGRLESRRSARGRLPVPEDRPLFLIFGIMKAYKGVEEVIAYWKKTRPEARLAVVGWCSDRALAARMRMQAGDCPDIYLSLDKWLSDEELKPWLAAADGVIFNYTRMLTSGAASLARSLGIPILIHRRARTIDLAEPHPTVVRYDSVGDDLGRGIARVIALSATMEKSERDPAWDAAIAWPGIAGKTAAVYRRVLADRLA